MISFLEYLTESAYSNNLKMFGFLNNLKIDKNIENQLGSDILEGTIEKWHDGSYNLKSRSRKDLLHFSHTISKKDGEKYNLKEGKIGDQINNIIKYLEDNPKKFEQFNDATGLGMVINTILFTTVAAPVNIYRITKDVKDFPAPWKLWIFRFYKYKAILYLLGQEVNKLEGFDNSSPNLNNVKILLKEMSKVKFNASADLQKILDTLQPDESFEHVAPVSKILRWVPSRPPHSYSVYEHINKMKHYLSLNYALINSYDPTGKDSSEMYSELDNLEDKWRMSVKGKVTKDEDTTVLFKVGNMEWHHVNREYCRNEGDAMGHCGNAAEYGPGDTILSLRSIKDKKHYTPHVTFILKNDGYLGEMKGRANEKPAPKYHEAILQLLTYKTNGNWLVKGIRGGGYLEHSNFSLYDLSEEDTLRLKEVRPDLYK